MPVEVGEEEEEHGAVEEDDVAEDLWEVALDEEGEGGVDEEGDKLAQLHSGEVPGVKFHFLGVTFIVYSRAPIIEGKERSAAVFSLRLCPKRQTPPQVLDLRLFSPTNSPGTAKLILSTLTLSVWTNHIC